MEAASYVSTIAKMLAANQSIFSKLVMLIKFGKYLFKSFNRFQMSDLFAF